MVKFYTAQELRVRLRPELKHQSRMKNRPYIVRLREPVFKSGIPILSYEYLVQIRNQLDKPEHNNKPDRNRSESNKLDYAKLKNNKRDAVKAKNNKLDLAKPKHNKLDPIKTKHNQLDSNKMESAKADCNRSELTQLDRLRSELTNLDSGSAFPDHNKIDRIRSDSINKLDLAVPDHNKINQNGSDSISKLDLAVPDPEIFIQEEEDIVDVGGLVIKETIENEFRVEPTVVQPKQNNTKSIIPKNVANTRNLKEKTLNMAKKVLELKRNGITNGGDYPMDESDNCEDDDEFSSRKKYPAETRLVPQTNAQTTATSIPNDRPKLDINWEELKNSNTNLTQIHSRLVGHLEEISENEVARNFLKQVLFRSIQEDKPCILVDLIELITKVGYQADHELWEELLGKIKRKQEISSKEKREYYDRSCVALHRYFDSDNFAVPAPYRLLIKLYESAKKYEDSSNFQAEQQFPAPFVQPGDRPAPLMGVVAPQMAAHIWDPSSRKLELVQLQESQPLIDGSRPVIKIKVPQHRISTKSLFSERTEQSYYGINRNEKLKTAQEEI